MTVALFSWYLFLVAILISIPYTYWRIIYIKKNVPKLIRWLSYFGVFTFTAVIALALSNIGYIGNAWIAFFIIMALVAHQNLLKHFSKIFILDAVDKNDNESGGI